LYIIIKPYKFLISIFASYLNFYGVFCGADDESKGNPGEDPVFLGVILNISEDDSSCIDAQNQAP
jgi:hypothetical protein